MLHGQKAYDYAIEYGKSLAAEELTKVKNDLEVESVILSEVTNLGVYPKSVVGGDGAYDERSQKMEGWNEHAFEIINLVIKLRKDKDFFNLVKERQSEKTS